MDCTLSAEKSNSLGGEYTTLDKRSGKSRNVFSLYRFTVVRFTLLSTSVGFIIVFLIVNCG